MSSHAIPKGKGLITYSTCMTHFTMYWNLGLIQMTSSERGFWALWSVIWYFHGRRVQVGIIPIYLRKIKGDISDQTSSPHIVPTNVNIFSFNFVTHITRNLTTSTSVLEAQFSTSSIFSLKHVISHAPILELSLERIFLQIVLHFRYLRFHMKISKRQIFETKHLTKFYLPSRQYFNIMLNRFTHFTFHSQRNI